MTNGLFPHSPFVYESNVTYKFLIFHPIKGVTYQKREVLCIMLL